MKKIKLIHVDGKLPNLALMKLSSFYKNNGYEIDFSKSIDFNMFEKYEKIYASSIFSFSENKRKNIKEYMPECIIGGTGSNTTQTVEDIIGSHDTKYDYSLYPDFPFSIGFSQRGCRMKCPFCVVPKKEGKVKDEMSINEIWRGENHPKKIVLLDNDFFGQPYWKEKIDEIIKGKFQVCFSQGINVRLINEDVAHYLTKINYKNSTFTLKRLYTAWDNLKDENLFLKKIDMLLKAGIKPFHIMVYMLIGFDPNETWDKIFYRFNKMKDIGLMVYPMVYNNERKDLKKFQRWVIRRYHQFIKWENYSS